MKKHKRHNPLTNENIDIVFSFDTTGSMYPCMSQLKRNVESTVKEIFKNIKNVNIGIIAHGDYCDAGDTYVTKHLPLTSNVNDVVRFVQTVGATGGGDAPECYELVLHEARSFNWRSGKTKVLVMIGDDIPHPPSYSMNTKKLDWRNEIELLMEMNVNVYGVQALNRRHATPFYEEIARKTGGYHLTLDQFNSVTDLIMAICYKQESPEALQRYEQQVQDRGRMTRNMDQVFSVLTGKKSTRYASKRPSKAADIGRFQVLDVDYKQSILDFVQNEGLTFSVGRGFYEWMKPENIQGHKEVILVDNRTGDVFANDEARIRLGLPTDGSDVRMKPNLPTGTTAFIQSTSYNRNLIGGTKFLYEVDSAR